MILFQLFETTTPFAGHDPVDAARQAAMLGARPGFPPRKSAPAVTEVRAGAGAGAFGLGCARFWLRVFLLVLLCCRGFVLRFGAAAVVLPPACRRCCCMRAVAGVLDKIHTITATSNPRKQRKTTANDHRHHNRSCAASSTTAGPPTPRRARRSRTSSRASSACCARCRSTRTTRRAAAARRRAAACSELFEPSFFLPSCCLAGPPASDFFFSSLAHGRRPHFLPSAAAHYIPHTPRIAYTTLPPIPYNTPCYHPYPPFLECLSLSLSRHCPFPNPFAPRPPFPSPLSRPPPPLMFSNCSANPLPPIF